MVLGLSSVVGLLPIIVASAVRMGLAVSGSWRWPRGLPLDLLCGDVGPWLLPLTVMAVIALLPKVTIDRHRVSIEKHSAAGIFVATLGVLPMLYGAVFWMSMAVLVLVTLVLVAGARVWGHDTFLVLGLALLAIVRVCAYDDHLADQLGGNADCVDLSRRGAVGTAPACQRGVPHLGVAAAARVGLDPRSD